MVPISHSFQIWHVYWWRHSPAYRWKSLPTTGFPVHIAIAIDFTQFATACFVDMWYVEILRPSSSDGLWHMCILFILYAACLSRRRGSSRSVIDDINFPMAILAYFFFSSLSSVKTTSLQHTPNDLFDQIWRKGVPFSSLVQKFSTPLYSPSPRNLKFFIVKCGFS